MFTGIFSGAAEKMQANPNVMAATYDAAIKKRAARFDVVQTAVADQKMLKERRVGEIKTLNDKIDKLAKIKAGAAAMAKRLTEQLKSQGKTADDIKVNPDFLKHMSAYQDASTSLTDAEKLVKEKEVDMEERSTQIANFMAELQQMQRDNQKLREEKTDAIAETQIAKQTESIKRVMAGIASDTTDKDLEAARAARDRAKASAKIISDLAGNDAQVAESAYLQYASNTENADEFAKLVGLDEGQEETVSQEATLDPAKLPSE
jgi:hypothetical protein